MKTISSYLKSAADKSAATADLTLGIVGRCAANTVTVGGAAVAAVGVAVATTGAVVAMAGTAVYNAGDRLMAASQDVDRGQAARCSRALARLKRRKPTVAETLDELIQSAEAALDAHAAPA